MLGLGTSSHFVEPYSGTREPADASRIDGAGVPIDDNASRGQVDGKPTDMHWHDATMAMAARGVCHVGAAEVSETRLVMEQQL